MIIGEDHTDTITIGGVKIPGYDEMKSSNFMQLRWKRLCAELD